MKVFFRADRKLIVLAFASLFFSVSAGAAETCSNIFTVSSTPSNKMSTQDGQGLKTPQYVSEILKGYFKFPTEHRELIEDFTGTLADSLNWALSQKEEIRSQKYLKIRDELNQALRTIQPFQGYTYSGAALRPETFQEMDLKVGKEFQFNYFFSTSLKKTVALEFIDKGIRKNKDEKRIAVLFLVKGTGGREISQRSQYMREAEILFRSDAKFKVESISQSQLNWRNPSGPDNKGFIITLKEITDKVPALNQKAAIVDAKVVPDMIEAQRFVELEDWQTAIKERPEDPWNFYGIKFFQSWKKADEFLTHRPSTHVLSWDLFEEVHRMIGGNHEHQDRATKTGSSTPESKKFEKETLELLLSNPFFHVETTSIKKMDEFLYSADIYRIPPENMQAVLQYTISESQKMLSQAKTSSEYIWAVAKLEYALLSIHPFSEENGRTIRLVRDWLLRKKGLAIPLRPITSEIKIPFEQFYNETVNSMNRYIDAKAMK